MGRSVILAGRSIQNVGATLQHWTVLLPAHRRPKAASTTGTWHLTSSIFIKPEKHHLPDQPLCNVCESYRYT